MRYRLIGVVLRAVALGLTSDAFATASNLLNVLRQASLIFLSASGLTLVIVGAGLDLSVGANLGLSACFAAAAVKSTGSLSLGFVAGLACGITVGYAEWAGWSPGSGCLPSSRRTECFWMLYGVNYW